MSTELHSIARAGALYGHPRRRCAGHYAVTATGTPISPLSVKAVRWCPIGALCVGYRIHPDRPDEYKRQFIHAVAAADLLACRFYRRTLSGLGDNDMGEEALDVLRRTWMWISKNPTSIGDGGG